MSTDAATDRADDGSTAGGSLAVATIWIPIFLWMAPSRLVRGARCTTSTSTVRTGGSCGSTPGSVRPAPSRAWRSPSGSWSTPGAPSDAGTPEGRTRFLAWQGVLAGLANLALILAEGSLVAFISRSVR